MRYRILAQLQKPHERILCEIDHPPPPGTGVDLRGHIVGRVELTNTGKAIVARGRVTGEAMLVCSRCLREFSWPLEIEFTERCALQQIDDPSAYATAAEDEDLIPILDEEEVDLSELVRQLIVVETPLQPLCRPNCPGLCPNCGALLGERPCRCATDVVDPRWAKLRDLLDE